MRKRYFRIVCILVGILFLYFFIGRFNYLLSKIVIRTIVAKEGVAEVSVLGEGLMVRNEQIVTSPITGLVLFLVEDKQQVRAGQIVAEVSEDKTGEAQQKIKAIDLQIEALDKNADQEANELRKRIQGLTEHIDVLKEELSALLTSGKGDLASGLSESLNEVQKRLEQAEIEYSTLRVNTEQERLQLIASRNSVMDDLKSETVLIKAQTPGLISLGYDGFKQTFSVGEAPEVLWDLKGFSKQLQVASDATLVESGEAICRLIDNFQVHLFVVIEDHIDLKMNQWVWLRWEGIEEPGERAKVISIHNQKDKIGVWFTLDVFRDEFADLRYLQQVNLVTEYYKGVVIPKNAVDESRDRSGVFIMTGGKPVFRYIEVIGGDGNNVVVDKVPVGSTVVINPQRIARK